MSRMAGDVDDEADGSAAELAGNLAAEDAAQARKARRRRAGWRRMWDGR